MKESSNPFSPISLNSAPIPPPPASNFFQTVTSTVPKKKSSVKKTPPLLRAHPFHFGKKTAKLPTPRTSRSRSFPFPTIFSVSSLYPPSLPRLANPLTHLGHLPPLSSSPTPPFQQASQTPSRRWSVRGICCCAAGANGWEGKGGGRVEKGGAGCEIVVQWGGWNGRFGLFFNGGL